MSMGLIVELRVDLYLYVVEGITFTDSTEDFEKQFTKSTFAVVDKIDVSAYDVSSPCP